MGNRSSLPALMPKNITFYSDISENLNINPMTNQLALVTNEQDVIGSMRRLISIASFEREYEKLGPGIEDLLFQPGDAATAIALQDRIKNVLNSYEPRAKLQSVSVINAPSDQYIITVVFTMINNPAPITFEHILFRVR